MKCKDHPDAPHGFCRNESHTQDRYVCECEFWEPEEKWNDLTDDELWDIFVSDDWTGRPLELMDKTIEKFKEKNSG